MNSPPEHLLPGLPRYQIVCPAQKRISERRDSYPPEFRHLGPDILLRIFSGEKLRATEAPGVLYPTFNTRESIRFRRESRKDRRLTDSRKLPSLSGNDNQLIEVSHNQMQVLSSWQTHDGQFAGPSRHQIVGSRVGL